jgi:1-acyl-sn-glycerol-3-phosphate acyltransferase
MIGFLARCWRITVTGVGFAALSIGGLLLAVAVIPLACLPIRDESARADRAGRIIRRSFRIFIGALRAAGVIRVEVVGIERFASACGNLIIANHPTLLDVVLLMTLLPNAQCVVKRQLWRSPFLGPLVRIAGYIANDEPPESLIEKCRASLAAKRNLIVFPEGTRSVPGMPLRFHRGFAHIATLTEAELRLVVISCRPAALLKGQRWFDTPASTPRFRLELGEIIEMRRFHGDAPRPLRVRRLTSYVESYYHRMLAHV